MYTLTHREIIGALKRLHMWHGTRAHRRGMVERYREYEHMRRVRMGMV
jgi:hypothetical protein